MEAPGLIPQPVQIRARNAAATRAALLEAARARFASLGYDATSLRDVAAAAGVDAALVSRYFGSKDDLFAEVLASLDDDGAWLKGDRESFAGRIAAQMVETDCEEGLDCLLIALRSIGSAKAHEALQPWSDANFHQPLRDAVGAGEDAEVRARLAGAVLMGVAITRALRPDFGLDEAQRARFTERLADLLQACVRS